MDVDTLIAIATALGIRELLNLALNEFIRGRREAMRAKGLTPDARNETAFYAEAYADTRERALAAGMSPEELGPRRVYVAPAPADGTPT